MRKIAFSLLAFAVAGCGQSGDAAWLDQVIPKETVGDKLAKGDASVCADENVEATLFRTIMGEGSEELYNKFLKSGGSLKLSLVSMTDTNPAAKEVTCSATLPVTLANQVEYKLRPAATGDGYVIEVRSSEGADIHLVGAFVRGELTERAVKAGLIEDPMVVARRKHEQEVAEWEAAHDGGEPEQNVEQQVDEETGVANGTQPVSEAASTINAL